MNARDPAQGKLCLEATTPEGADLLRPLVEAPVSQPVELLPTSGVHIGELVAITNEGRTPLVVYPGQPGSAAIAARTTVDLHGAHIGKQVILMFEAGNPARPIVMGLLREGEGWPLEQKPNQVEVDADGERMIISAREQLVLRCGKSSITLTKAGKILVEGTYISSKSSGVNRMRGGSIELN